jgi:hypothetical protein
VVFDNDLYAPGAFVFLTFSRVEVWRG